MKRCLYYVLGFVLAYVVSWLFLYWLGYDFHKLGGWMFAVATALYLVLIGHAVTSPVFRKVR